MKYILASASPRRRELLSLAGIEYDIVPSDCDESLPENIQPSDAVLMLSERKAEDVSKKCGSESAVIAADTVVAVDGKILGKPKTENDAFNMLKMLSGRIHKVFTGVCILQDNKKDCFFSETEVEFYSLSDDEIRRYIKTGEPMDKAGAYGIQGKGSLLVKRINGDYFNVVGLPLAETVRHMNIE